MSRILIGDVGCGKTVCAAIALYVAVKSGHQAALMAPTEILARQHFSDLSALFKNLGIQPVLLLGSTPKKEKERLCAGLLSHSPQRVSLVIGTHALLSENIAFSDLALVVTDEQHRFGVMQRARLREKGNGCHLLVMSATPIPRSLALTLYGDLDLSRIQEMPKGRQRVETFVVDSRYKPRLHAFIRKEVANGGQVYIVCPAVDNRPTNDAVPESGEITFDALASMDKFDMEEDSPSLCSAVSLAEELSKNVFPDLTVGVLHGRMKTAEKDAVMADFQSGRMQILVSTTVIEVGVNVPNASLMIVENAERFGLAQLHQLRGRVGRGQRKSYCILISDVHGNVARERLNAMKTTYDGYAIAEADLRLRGPGDFFRDRNDESLRQSGGLAFPLAHLCNDTDFMKTAMEEGRAVAAADPDLSLPEHAGLRKEIQSIFEEHDSTVS